MSERTGTYQEIYQNNSESQQCKQSFSTTKQTKERSKLLESRHKIVLNCIIFWLLNPTLSEAGSGKSLVRCPIPLPHTPK